MIRDLALVNGFKLERRRILKDQTILSYLHWPWNILSKRKLNIFVPIPDLFSFFLILLVTCALMFRDSVGRLCVIDISIKVTNSISIFMYESHFRWIEFSNNFSVC